MRTICTNDDQEEEDDWNKILQGYVLIRSICSHSYIYIFFLTLII